MTDIVERLRDKWVKAALPVIAPEAADEIESLRQQLATFKNAYAEQIELHNLTLDELAECETKWNDAADCCAKGTTLLAECQAREKKLREFLPPLYVHWPDLVQQAMDIPSDSTALDSAIRQTEERVEASYKVELDLLREIGEILEPIEYLGSYAEGIKAAIRQAKREALLELSDMISTLNACEQAAEIRRIADKLKS